MVTERGSAMIQGRDSCKKPFSVPRSQVVEAKSPGRSLTSSVFEDGGTPDGLACEWEAS